MVNKKKVLFDHKRVGKKFIPPMLQLPGGMKFIKWLDTVLPEIIWIALLQEKLGVKRSIEICSVIAKKINDLCHDGNTPNLASISNYKKLTNVQAEALLTFLSENKMLDEFSNSLKPLVILYPDCPIKKIVIFKEEKTDFLNYFKTVLDKYFYRRVHVTNLIEATTLCMSILSNRVKYCNNVSPPNLDNLITQSPQTQLYEKTASSVRATTLSLLDGIDESWSNYFWNRGLILDKCK